MTNTRAIQYTDTARDEAQAREMFDACSIQTDFLGGRVLEPDSKSPTWRIQAFFEDVDAAWLPDGCQHVIVPDSMKRLLQLRDWCAYWSAPESMVQPEEIGHALRNLRLETN